MKILFWMMNSCFCFSTSGSLSNPPQEKAQLKWCGRLHRLFLYHLVKTDIIMETKAYLLKRKHFQSPRWNHSLPDVGKYIPSIIHYCNWFSVWVIKVIIFLASAIDRSLAQPAVLSAWAASFPNPLTTSHTCWTSGPAQMSPPWVSSLAPDRKTAPSLSRVLRHFVPPISTGGTKWSTAE